MAAGSTGAGLSGAFQPTVRSGGIDSSVESLGPDRKSPMGGYGSDASGAAPGGDGFHTPKGSFDGSLDELAQQNAQQQAVSRQAV